MRRVFSEKKVESSSRASAVDASDSSSEARIDLSFRPRMVSLDDEDAESSLLATSAEEAGAAAGTSEGISAIYLSVCSSTCVFHLLLL